MVLGVRGVRLRGLGQAILLQAYVAEWLPKPVTNPNLSLVV